MVILGNIFSSSAMQVERLAESEKGDYVNWKEEAQLLRYKFFAYQLELGLVRIRSVHVVSWCRDRKDPSVDMGPGMSWARPGTADYGCRRAILLLNFACLELF